MKFNLRRLVFLALLSMTAHSSHGKTATHYTMPNVSLVPLEDSVNQRQYQLYIKLPEGYENAPKNTILCSILRMRNGILNCSLLQQNTA